MGIISKTDGAGVRHRDNTAVGNLDTLLPEDSTHRKDAVARLTAAGNYDPKIGIFGETDAPQHLLDLQRSIVRIGGIHQADNLLSGEVCRRRIIQMQERILRFLCKRPGNCKAVAGA